MRNETCHCLQAKFWQCSNLKPLVVWWSSLFACKVLKNQDQMSDKVSCHFSSSAPWKISFLWATDSLRWQLMRMFAFSSVPRDSYVSNFMECSTQWGNYKCGCSRNWWTVKSKFWYIVKGKSSLIFVIEA